MLKTHDEVLTALQDRSEVERLITKVNKGGKGTFSYVPWNQTVRLLDTVFGPFGWSANIVGTFNDSERGIYRTDMELTVRAVTEHGVLEAVRPGTGVGIVPGTQLQNAEAHDTAIKGSRSDAISVAAKALGDAFGLYLYDRGDPTSSAATSARQQQTHTPTTNAAAASSEGAVKRNNFGGIGFASEKRTQMMLDRGYTDVQISNMDKDTVAAVCNAFFEKTTPPVAPAGQAKQKNAAPAKPAPQPPVETLDLSDDEQDDAIPF